ncbi:class I tRNA ligase family protein [Aestuariivirga sp.]|uniref:class I tRNA ligase family protein n=1 Tax=Aestuariivirga sp. TaxID=2650926 RepID=UPI003BAB68B4
MPGALTPEPYLLVPAMPTPNGPLHLGHVSGPYLKTDVMARALRRAGHRVALVSASDSWEMHVLPRAIRENRSPEEICATYHSQIEDCFDQLNIRFDAFFNPIDKSHSDRAEEVYRSLYSELATDHPLAGITFRPERITYSLPHAQPVLGSHIAGQCPNCGVPDLGGFYCEDCGFEISPEDIIGYWSELPNDSSEWQDYTSAFIRIYDTPAFRRELEKRCQDLTFIDLAMASLSFNKSATRLSHPARWGAKLHDQRVSAGSVFFSYPGMYALSILCGEVAKDFLGQTVNPFKKESGVTLVKSFGFDNTAPYLIGATAIGLTSKDWRPFDHYLTNHFATLEGSKFSTSGNHAIWANVARRQLATSSDSLRAYLCWMNPQHQCADFSEAAFSKFKLDWEDRIRALAHAPATQPMDGADYHLFIELLDTQLRLLEPGSLNLRKAFETLDSWLTHAERRRATSSGQSWSLAFAMLAYPFLPGLGKTLIDNAGAENGFTSNLPAGLAGVNAVRSAYDHILSSPAEIIIKGGHHGGHRPDYL